MAFVKVTISDDLRTLPARFQQKVRLAQAGVALLTETNIKQQIRAVGAVASEQLLRSVKRLKSESHVVSVGSNLVQAGLTEYGRRSNRAIPRWSIFKPILQRWAAQKGISASASHLWLIARKIQREGFAGRYPFQKATRITEPQAVQIVERELRGL